MSARSATPRDRSLHGVVFTDPLAFRGLADPERHEDVLVELNERMANQLTGAPTPVYSDAGEDADGNGFGEPIARSYVFGPEFPLGEYQLLGQHTSFGTGSTGFVDRDEFERQARLPGTESLARKARGTMLDVYEGDGEPYDSIDGLNRVHERFRWVLFVGYGAADAHRPGAQLFAHRDAFGAIDGLIIDTGYLYPREWQRAWEEAASEALVPGVSDLEWLDGATNAMFFYVSALDARARDLLWRLRFYRKNGMTKREAADLADQMEWVRREVRLQTGREEAFVEALKEVKDALGSRVREGARGR